MGFKRHLLQSTVKSVTGWRSIHWDGYMFTKVPLRLAKWQLVLADLGLQVTAKGITWTCFGKATEVRERTEREQSPRLQVPGAGQDRDVQVGDERSRCGRGCLPGLQWETGVSGERALGPDRWLLRERTQHVSWGEGGVSCMAGDITSVCVLCKHLCASTAETQASVEWRNGKTKPRHYQYPESTLRWYEAPLEPRGLMISVEKRHKDCSAPSSLSPSKLSLGPSSEPLFSQWSGSFQAEKYSPAWHIANQILLKAIFLRSYISLITYVPCFTHPSPCFFFFLPY